MVILWLCLCCWVCGNGCWVCLMWMGSCVCWLRMLILMDGWSWLCGFWWVWLMKWWWCIVMICGRR